MISIPFIGGAYEQRSPFINAQRSINCFPVIDNKESNAVIAMYGTPGLISWVRIEGYGVPNDIDMVISKDTTLDAILRVDNLTINAGVTLDTAGYAIVVSDTLINNGTIVDTVSGGVAGEGGEGGLPLGSVYAAPGELGTQGRDGLKFGAGRGGDGGFGGESGAGSSVMGEGKSYFYDHSPIYGDRGGYGGDGGRGGGRVIIYARTLTNNGTISVPGEDATDGGDGVAGAMVRRIDHGGVPKYGNHIALLSSGSDGGKGGSGGDGGSVSLFYETLTEGTINVAGGKKGTGGTGGAGSFYGGTRLSGGVHFGYSWVGWPHTITAGDAADGTLFTAEIGRCYSLYSEPGWGAGTKEFLDCQDYTASTVKVSTKLSTDYEGFYAYKPKKNFIGTAVKCAWISSSPTNQKMHIDVGTARIATKIQYHNFVDWHNYSVNSYGDISQLQTTRGIKNFTLWGSNSATAFGTVTYGNHTDWTQLTTAASSFDEYAVTDTNGNLDLNEIDITNEIAYRYYAFEFADNYGDASYMGIKHLALYGEEIDIHGKDGDDGTITKTVLTYPDLDLDSTELRCMRVFDDNLYVVIGSGVFSVDTDGEITNYGNLTTSTGFVDMAYNGVEILIVDGTAFGMYISAGALESVSPESDFPVATSCTFMDGYFIVTREDTGQIWISGVYDVNSWDALDYATAEGAPDVATRVLSTNHNLWVFGVDTAEIFYNSGNADFPFTRINGGLIEDGLGASESVCVINSQFYFINARREIVRNVGYQREKISTIHLDTELQSYATVADAKGWEYRLDGHIFYVLTFPTADKTWVFDVTTEFWHEWSSFKTAGVATYGRHRGVASAYFDGKWLVGDYDSATIYELSMSAYTEDGEQIVRTRRAQTIGSSANYLTHDRLELIFETGIIPSTEVYTQNPTVNLRWSDDGANTWSSLQSRTLGERGEYANRVIWNRLGKSRSRIYELTMTEPVSFVLKSCIADIKGASA